MSYEQVLPVVFHYWLAGISEADALAAADYLIRSEQDAIYGSSFAVTSDVRTHGTRSLWLSGSSAHRLLQSSVLSSDNAARLRGQFDPEPEARR